MAFEVQFLDMMTGSLTYRPTTSVDGYGQSTLGTAVVLPAKITYKTSIVRGDNEENTTSTAQVVVPPPGYVLSPSVVVPTIAIGGHITLADNIERRVLSISTPFDESGSPHHQSASLT